MGRTTMAAGPKQRERVAEGVYRKPNGKYLATYRDPGRKQRWKEFKTKSEAVRWRARGTLDPQSMAFGKRTLEETWLKLLEHHGTALRGSTSGNPAAARGTRVKLPQVRRARVLSPDEVRNVLAAARSVASATDVLAIEALFFLGLRIGEMAGLQAHDLDADAGS